MDKAQYNKEVGLRISGVRSETGIRAEKVAEGAGIALQTLSNIEGGKRACKTTTIYGICSTLGVSADYILGLAERDAHKNILVQLDKLKPKEISLVEKFIQNLIEVYQD